MLLRDGADVRTVSPANTDRSHATDRFLAAAQKFQALWSVQARQSQRAGDPQWLQHLRNYDFEKAGTALTHELGRLDPLAVWTDAVEHGHTDLAKALITLSDHEFTQRLRTTPLEAKPENPLLRASIKGKLHGALQLGDERLAAYVKQLPYYSMKPERQLTAMLNLQAHFPDNGQRIECRHLALEWLEQARTSPNGKVDYGRMRTAEDIAAHVPSTREPQYYGLLAHAEAHMVNIDSWNEFADKQALEMAANGITTKRMLIATGLHAMAAEFKLKHDSGKPELVQNIYDPNLTDVHSRSRHDPARTIGEGESLRAFIGRDPVLQLSAFGTEKSVIVLTIPEAGIGSVPAARQPRPAGRRFLTAPQSLDANTMHWMLSGNFDGNLADFRQRLAMLSARFPNEVFERLQAKGGMNVPGLFNALQNGAEQVVAIFASIVEDSRLSSAQKVTLLAARRGADDVPGFAMALQHGHTSTVKAFIQSVEHASFSNQDKVMLLAGKDRPKRLPALMVAMTAAPEDTIRGYVEAVSRLGLPQAQIQDLLQAADANGTPALAYAMTHRHGEQTAAFVHAVLDAPLQEEAQLALLQARDDVTGKTAYEASTQDGPNPAAEAFRDAIERSRLSDDSKALLLNDSQGSAKRRRRL